MRLQSKGTKKLLVMGRGAEARLQPRRVGFGFTVIASHSEVYLQPRKHYDHNIDGTSPCSLFCSTYCGLHGRGPTQPLFCTSVSCVTVTLTFSVLNDLPPSPNNHNRWFKVKLICFMHTYMNRNRHLPLSTSLAIKIGVDIVAPVLTSVSILSKRLANLGLCL